MRILVTGGSGFIGTNFVQDAVDRGDDVLNLSESAPVRSVHRPYWREVDILDGHAVASAFQDFQPEAVVHLAARTDCDEKTTVEEGYRVNTDGTANVLRAVESTRSIFRLVVTSSQYVCGPGRQPEHDEDYFPHTVYGQSKVITEQITRRMNPPCIWTLVRPTNVWGPWHPRYADEIWRVIRKGFYVHPGGAPVVRSYGYVGNVIWQIRKILELPREAAHERVFYVGDRPGDIYEWTNAFSRALKGRPARRVPRWVLRSLAVGGDVISMAARRPFLINSSRYQSMITNYIPSMEPTFATLGEPPFSLDDGVAATIKWMDEINPNNRF